MSVYLDQLERQELHTRDQISEADARRIMDTFSDVLGVEVCSIVGAVVTVDRDPAIVSENMVIGIFDSLDIPRRMPRREGPFARRLRKMAESNKKEFGSGRLDCCDLPKE